jgi:type IV secretion system protein VirB9
MKLLRPLMLPVAITLFANSCLAVENSYNHESKMPDIESNVRTSIAINNNSEKAAEIATRSWQKTGVAIPIKANHGMVKYPFNESVPKVTCSPLHVCDIAIGDQVRWLTSPASSGAASKTIPHVIVKPVDENISTNMVVTTDKRTYYLYLTSKKTNYVTRLSFYYPHDIVQNWRHTAAVAQTVENSKIAEFSMLDATKLDFNYDIVGTNKRLQPLRVFNDGKHVYLQMNRELSSYEAPILMVIGKDNKTQLVNYRIKADYYIADRLFDKAELILGVGSHQEKVKISKKSLSSCLFNCKN